MPKLKTDAITIKDVAEYSKDSADFSFELKVAHAAKEYGMILTHSGIYRDPITNSAREYDIRGEIDAIGTNLKIRNLFAIECKNIRANFPLVVHCAKREFARAYQNVVFTPSLENQPNLTFLRPNQQIALRDRQGFYLANNSFGLSIDQVGRAKHGDSIVNNDEFTYSRVSQAINSSYDLIHSAVVDTGPQDTLSFIYPVVVIPDDRLFVIDYDSSFEPLTPTKKDMISLYSGHTWNIMHNTSVDFILSHIDIVTISHLHKYLESVIHVSTIVPMHISKIREAYANSTNQF